MCFNPVVFVVFSTYVGCLQHLGNHFPLSYMLNKSFITVSMWSSVFMLVWPFLSCKELREELVLDAWFTILGKSYQGEYWNLGICQVTRRGWWRMLNITKNKYTTFVFKVHKLNQRQTFKTSVFSISFICCCLISFHHISIQNDSSVLCGC